MDGTKTTPSPAGPAGTGLSFGPFRLEPDGTLRRGGEVVHLPPKELAALRLLIQHAGQIVSPLQIRQALWDDVHVSADSVPKCLSSLRARLEPDQCIQTVYKRGYRFNAEVQPFDSLPAVQLPRVVIAPFECGFGVPEYLGPAVAEEVMARLTRAASPIAAVLARDSIFTLSARGLSALEIGKALNAHLALAGALRMLSSHVRLRVEMIRVADGAQIWVEDILVDRLRSAALEAELVNRLLFRLGEGGLSISGYAEPPPALERRKRPERAQAYAIYQSAHYEWQTLERHRMQDSMQGLTRAAELDPALVPARVDLVNLCITQTWFGFLAPEVAAEIVHRTAQRRAGTEESRLRAEEPGGPAGHGRRSRDSRPELFHGIDALLPALGWIGFQMDRDLPSALRAFSLSAHLQDSSPIARLRAMFALSRHRFGEAIDMMRAQLQADPFSPWLHSRLAWALHLNGQAAESLKQAQFSLEHFPTHEGAILYAAIILAFNGQPQAAAVLARDLAQRQPYFDIAAAVHAYTLACAGKPADARAIIERLQWLSRERFVCIAFNPAVHVALGDHEAALAELRIAERVKCPWFFQMLGDPRLKPLRGHPEFQRMMAILSQMEEEAALDLEAEA